MNKQYTLPKEFAEKWLEVLTSGKYNQATGVLYDPSKDGYCCLGLAASICGVSNQEMEYKNFIQGDNFSFEEITQIRKKGYPEELSTIDRYACDKILGGVLAQMNDNGYTFEEIAEWIRENVELV